MRYADVERVRLLITESGLTQRELAAKLRLHLRSISHYVAGSRRMPARTASDLARIVARERAKVARQEALGAAQAPARYHPTSPTQSDDSGAVSAAQNATKGDDHA